MGQILHVPSPPPDSPSSSARPTLAHYPRSHWPSDADKSPSRRGRRPGPSFHEGLAVLQALAPRPDPLARPESLSPLTPSPSSPPFSPKAFVTTATGSSQSEDTVGCASTSAAVDYPLWLAHLSEPETAWAVDPDPESFAASEPPHPCGKYCPADSESLYGPEVYVVHVDYPPWLVDSLEQEARWDPEEEEEEDGADEGWVPVGPQTTHRCGWSCKHHSTAVPPPLRCPTPRLEPDFCRWFILRVRALIS